MDSVCCVNAELILCDELDLAGVIGFAVIKSLKICCKLILACLVAAYIPVCGNGLFSCKIVKLLFLIAAVDQ